MKTIDGNKSPVRTLSTPHLAPGSWTEISQSPKRKTNMIASMFQSATGRSSSLSLSSDHHDVHEVPRSSSISGFLAIKQRTRLKLLRQSSVVPSLSGATVNGSAAAEGAGPATMDGKTGGKSTASGSRSVSLASVSSDGSSSESQQLVEQEDIVALTQEVRAFKEALGKLRRLFGCNEPKDKCDALRVAAHERLGEVLRILRVILERYPALQSAELLVAAGSLIHQVKEHRYEDEKSDVKEFMESIDQLAMAFSSRVSEYLMGDLDGTVSLASSVSSKTKSCENLASDAENGGPGLMTEARKSASVASVVSSGASSSTATDQTALQQQQQQHASPHHHHGSAGIPSGSPTQAQQLSADQMDSVLLQLEQGVEVALHRAKLWSKYAKDIMTYVEKRSNLEVEFAKNVAKLAQTMRSALKEECYLPFQSVYVTAMDREIENSNATQTTGALLMGHKFLEPLSARRNEHERCRKQIKETWHRELKRMQEAVSNLRKAKALYVQRQQEWERAKEAAQRAENGAESSADQSAKLDKRKKTEEDALQKAMEAETTYKASVCEANERHSQLLRVKSQVLQQVRELMLQCDQTMKAVTVSYFQLQHTVSAPAPVQFQTLCESSRSYEPGSQYMEFIKRMPLPSKPSRDGTPTTSGGSPSSTAPGPYTFEPYSEEATAILEKDRKSNGSLSADSNDSAVVLLSKERAQSSGPIKAWSSSGVSSGASSSNVVTQVSSDTESVESSPSAKSRETSPTASPMMPARRLVPASSGDELENEPDTEVDASYMGYAATRRHCMSKAAVTHTFRKLKTPSRCRECDSYVYFQGAECIECGLGCHKKCLESLTIQCGHKRLPRKMTTFGVDLSQHLAETGTAIPHLLAKCINEIDNRGIQIKGLYRVSGVKSKVEKLCQSFENGADLVDLTDVHPNVIANVLKLYLRQLPEALLTSRLYPDFIRVAKEWTGPDSACGLHELSELVHKLPRQHYATLAFLMHHLKRVAAEQESNNMPASNLGIVFGPTLLRTSEGSASLSSLVDTVHQTRVIELLIEHADAIFGPPEANTPSAFGVGTGGSPAHRAVQHQPSKAELETSAASILSKVPVVRSISFLEKHRSKSRDSSDQAAGTGAIISTPADRRSHVGELREEILLPGFVADKTPNTSLDIDPLSEEGLLGPTSDDDLPDFLLPDDSAKARKLPGYLRTGSAPKIFKASLKDYHGLEGVDLNLLSSQDQETHPATPSRAKKSVSETTGPTSIQITEMETISTHSSVVQTASTAKTSCINPYMDSSIDSDHSWESHSTGSSGRGTQHSDQGSVGSVQRALLLTSGHDETDGRIEAPFSSLPAHRVSQCDENRVKIQVPSAACASWSASSFGPASIASVESSSSSSSTSSRGVVTVLEGPQSGTTIVECLSNDTVKNAGGGRSASSSGGATNMAAALVVSDLAAVPVGLTQEFTHVSARSLVVRSSATTSTTTSTLEVVAGASSGSSSAGTSPNSVKKGAVDRVPRFV